MHLVFVEVGAGVLELLDDVESAAVVDVGVGVGVEVTVEDELSSLPSEYDAEVVDASAAVDALEVAAAVAVDVAVSLDPELVAAAVAPERGAQLRYACQIGTCSASQTDVSILAPVHLVLS